MTEDIGVAVIGAGMAGRAHAHGYRSAGTVFSPSLPPVRLVSVADINDELAADTARRYGFERSDSSWQAIVKADDIDVVSVVVANHLHREIVEALAAAGKHVLCEKPLANTVQEAEQMAAAARAATERGAWAMCGFTYRRTPALALARRLIEAGRIGTVRQVRAQYLQDWLHDPDAPMTWRLDQAKSGSGALGDLGAHLVDTTQWLTGQAITGVSAILKTFVTSRPLSGERAGLGGHGDTGTDAPRGEVTVDDAALFTARFADGAIATFEATRFALGRKNALRVEINGTAGSIAFDFEENNVLQFFDGTESVEEQGFRRILVTEPEHPYVSAWWPPGHGLGYEHGFTHQVVDLIKAIDENRQPEPSFADGLQVQRVLGAVEDSAANDSGWTEVS
jgi:predicted dehydrogenase